MISLHGEVSGDSDIFEIHDVIDRIEKELKRKLGCEAVIHMDPIVVNNEKINETKKEIVEMIRKTSRASRSTISGWCRDQPTRT